jgi:beta-barrel assembly-enhancing protease
MPFGYGTQRGRGMNMRWIIAIVVAAVGIIGYLSKTKVTNPETGEQYRVAMTVDQEKALGLQAAKEMIPKMGGALDPRQNADAALVDEVGRRLVAQSGAAKSNYADNFNFFLVNDPETINAFALPGGQVSITVGLMNRLETEAQLAGVLGHEIGHVIAQHSAQQMAKGQLGQTIAMAVGIGASSEDGRGQYAAAAAQMANQMIQLKYGRDDERQSDEIGLKYMMQAGYHPEGMLGVMKVLKEASGGSRQPEFLASHPHPEERLATIQKFLEEHRDELANSKLTQGRPLHGRAPPTQNEPARTGGGFR